MNGDILLLGIIFFTTIALIYSKSHVAYISLALFGGEVLSERASYLLARNAGDWLVESGLPVYTVFKIFLLFGPPLLVAYHFRKSQNGAARLMEQLVPSFGLALLLVLFVVEQLHFTTRNELLDSSVALNQLWIYSPWVVVFALGSALFDIMMHKEKTSKSRS